jgi:hypothetical protein
MLTTQKIVRKERTLRLAAKANPPPEESGFDMSKRLTDTPRAGLDLEQFRTAGSWKAMKRILAHLAASACLQSRRADSRERIELDRGRFARTRGAVSGRFSPIRCTGIRNSHN